MYHTITYSTRSVHQHKDAMTVRRIINHSLVGCDVRSIGTTVTLVKSLCWGRAQASGEATVVDLLTGLGDSLLDNYICAHRLAVLVSETSFCRGQ